MVSRMYPPPVESRRRSNMTVNQSSPVLVEDRLVDGRSAMPIPPSHRGPAAPGRTAVLDRAPEPTVEAVLFRELQRLKADLPEPDPQPTTSGQLSWGQRTFRGLVLLGSIAAVALVVILPESGDSQTETALSTTATTAAPIARAESLRDSALPNVQISLERSSTLDAMELQARASKLGTPADTPGGFEAAITDAVQETLLPETPQTTTTTVWEEPPMPPESEWVDSGNGVAVPDILLRIRFCESTNNYDAANAGSSARGAYQFLGGSWDWYGHAAITGVAEAHLATRAQQDEAALRTLQAEGTGPWAESRQCWTDPDLDPRYATAKPPVAADDGPDTATTTTTVSDGTDTTDTTTETTVDTTDTTTDTTTPTTTDPTTTTPTTTDPTTTDPDQETTVPETTVTTVP